MELGEYKLIKMEYQDFPDLLFDSCYDPLEKDRLKSHLSSLLAVAKIDGELKRSEIDFLTIIAQNMGLTEEEMLDAFKNPQPPLPPLSVKDKVKNLVEIAMMISIDGPLDPRELQICYLIASRYGLKESKMNTISAKVHPFLKEKRISMDNYSEVVEILYKELKNSFPNT